MDPVDFEHWALGETQARWRRTPKLWALARRVALEGWRERSAQRGFSEPKDLANSCKFTSLMAKILFGGKICGNFDHQFNWIEGKARDLNSQASDVRRMKRKGQDPHLQDWEFFGNPEHMESMYSCFARSAQWASRFGQAALAEGHEPLCPAREASGAGLSVALGKEARALREASLEERRAAAAGGAKPRMR